MPTNWRKLNEIKRVSPLNDEGFRPLLLDSDYANIFSKKDDRCLYKKCKRKALVFPALLFYYKGSAENVPCGKLVVDLPLCFYCKGQVKLNEIVEQLGGWFDLLKPWREDSRVKGIPDPRSTRLVFYFLMERTSERLSLDAQIEIAKLRRLSIQ